MSSYSDVLSTGTTTYGIIAVVVTTVLTAIATILSVMRFMFRRKVGFGIDDYLLMVVLVFLMIQLIIQYLKAHISNHHAKFIICPALGALQLAELSLMAANFGKVAFLGAEGATMEYLAQHPDKMIITLKLIYFPVLSYTLVVVLIKTSILYSYKNIFGHVKMTKYHIYILLGLTWAWGIGSFFPAVFQCSPIDKAWLPMKPGHCIGLMPYLWATSISNFIIDWLILAVPIPPVLKLHLPLNQKILVGLSFMCGSLACIASTVRSARTGEFDPTDLGVSNFNASIWVYIEIPLATISCCLPFLSRPVGSKIAKSFRSTWTRITGRTSKGSSPENSKGKSSGYGSYDSSPDTMKSQSLPIEGLSHDGRNIHLLTTTTVDSRPMSKPEGAGVVSYGYTVVAPTKGREKSDSERSLV